MTQKLLVGTQAPDFALLDADGTKVSLSDYRGRNVIVYFYPKAATPGCTTEACDFRDNLASLQGNGYDVIGISPDAPEALAKFTGEFALTFPLLVVLATRRRPPPPGVRNPPVPPPPPRCAQYHPLRGSGTHRTHLHPTGVSAGW